MNDAADPVQHFHDLAAALARRAKVNLCDAEHGNPRQADVADLTVIHDSAVAMGADCPGHSPHPG